MLKANEQQGWMDIDGCVLYSCYMCVMSSIQQQLTQKKGEYFIENIFYPDYMVLCHYH